MPLNHSARRIAPATPLRQVLRLLCKEKPFVSEWDRVSALASEHDVLPSVCDALASAPRGSVPDDVRASVSAAVRRNRTRNAVLAMETARIVALLRGNGIEMAVFKGPLLAEHVYGGLSLRDFLDIDILVRPADVPRARLLLEETGYRGGGREGDVEYVAELGQCALRHQSLGCTIDLHWKLTPFGLPFPFPEAEIWRDLQELPLAGVSVPTFSWDHLALFLAFHGSKERWRKLKWICDFSTLYTARPELDWEALRRKAARSHCSRSLLVAACLCDTLGLPAPAELAAAGRRDSSVASLVDRVVARLDSPREESDLSIFLDEIAATERWRDKTSHTLAMLTTPTVSDFEAVRLPARLRPLYYLIRPVRLAGKVAGLLYRPRAER